MKTRRQARLVLRSATWAPISTGLGLTASSSNTTLVPDGSVQFGGSGADRTLIVTPAADQTGTATITVTLSDQSGLTTTTTFVVTVNAVDTAPTITSIANQSTQEDVASGAIAFTVDDADTDVSSLVVTTRSSNPVLLPNANIVPKARIAPFN